mgnify:CR=1 FL=1
MGAIKATSANGWTRREKVEGAERGRGVSRRRAETLARESEQNIRVSTGGFMVQLEVVF